MWEIHCEQCKKAGKGVDGDVIQTLYTEFAAKIYADMHNIANGHDAWAKADTED